MNTITINVDLQPETIQKLAIWNGMPPYVNDPNLVPIDPNLLIPDPTLTDEQNNSNISASIVANTVANISANISANTAQSTDYVKEAYVAKFQKIILDDTQLFQKWLVQLQTQALIDAAMVDVNNKITISVD